VAGGLRGVRLGLYALVVFGIVDLVSTITIAMYYEFMSDSEFFFSSTHSQHLGGAGKAGPLFQGEAEGDAG
jgi:hypothetical protein